MDRGTINQRFWAKEPKETIEILQSSEKDGLSQDQAKERQLIFGPNILEKGKQLSKTEIFLNQLKSPLIFILIVSGGATAILKDYLDTLFILLAVLINSILGFYQENKAEETLEKLKTYIKENIRVLRDKKETEIDSQNIVPGEIIYLTAGKRVPADARLISANDLQIDESVLTGESLPQEKQTESLKIDIPLSERTNMVFGGTLVVEGAGKAIITATGKDSEFGKLASLVSEAKDTDTPLQKTIKRFSWTITGFLIVLILGIFWIGAVKGYSLFEMFLTSVAIAISSIPEGLPIAMTIILAVGVEQLAKKKGVVKKLIAAEALSATTTILTDKTGTLTQAKMTITGIWSLADLISKKLTAKTQALSRLSDEQKKIIKISLLNTDVLIVNPEEKPENWQIAGKALETSLVKQAGEWKILFGEEKNLHQPFTILPFNSKDKYSASIIKDSGGFHSLVGKRQKGNFLTIMGAPEILLSMAELSAEDYQAVLGKINQLARSGKRILAVGFKQLNQNLPTNKAEALKNLNQIEFLGIICFSDPLREDVLEAIEKVKQMGLKAVIVTGDHQGTAMAIAKELGFEIKENNVLDGSAISRLSDEELEKILPQIRVFARVTPEDKLRIINAYRKSREIIAMTGDGVNDAPALKQADVGIAVGSGTDVTKSVADLILLDDSFKTIVTAIEEGRKMLLNIKKVIVYLLSDSLEEVFLIGGSLLMSLPLPINALQILFVNFFADSFPALAFAFENGVDDHKKRIKQHQILDKEVKTLIFFIGASISLGLFLVYWWLLKTGVELSLVKTIVFITFSINSLIVAFSFRSLEKNIFHYNPFSNRYLNWGAGLGIVLTLSAVYLPPSQKVLETAPLPLIWLTAPFGFGLFSIFIIEAVKFLFAKKINVDKPKQTD
ncbi:MAG: HAD-IC family P-type ATPase [Patescibacteria group bacterium]